MITGPDFPESLPALERNFMKPSKQVVVGSRCFCPEPAMRGVGMELGVSSAFNLIREFAPEVKRMFRWR